MEADYGAKIFHKQVQQIKFHLERVFVGEEIKKKLLPKYFDSVFKYSYTFLKKKLLNDLLLKDLFL